MIDAIITWLVRFVHVASAGWWVGGYALLALAVVPLLRDGAAEPARRAALAATRVLTYAGVLTVLSGAVLIARTRGYDNLFGGEWGGIVIGSFLVAVALLGIGDAALRPALKRLPPEGASAAQRWALIALLLGLAAIAMMTRAIYARS